MFRTVSLGYLNVETSYKFNILDDSIFINEGLHVATYNTRQKSKAISLNADTSAKSKMERKVTVMTRM